MSQNNINFNPQQQSSSTNIRSPPLLQLSINQVGSLYNNQQQQSKRQQSSTKRSLQSSAQPNQKSRTTAQNSLTIQNFSNTNSSSMYNSMSQNNNNLMVSSKDLYSNNENEQKNNANNMSKNDKCQNNSKQHQEICQLQYYLKIKGADILNNHNNNNNNVMQKQQQQQQTQNNKVWKTQNDNNNNMNNCDSLFSIDDNKLSLKLNNINKENKISIEYDKIFNDNINMQQLFTETSIQLQINSLLKSLQNCSEQQQQQMLQNNSKQLSIVIVGEQKESQNELFIGNSQVSSKQDKEKQNNKSRQPSRIPAHSSTMNKKLQLKMEKNNEGLIQIIFSELLSQIENNKQVLVSLLIQNNATQKLEDFLNQNNLDNNIFIIGSQILKNQHIEIKNQQDIKTFIQIIQNSKDILTQHNFLIQIKIINQQQQQQINNYNLYSQSVINIAIMKQEDVFQQIQQLDNNSLSNIQLFGVLKPAYYGIQPLIVLQCLDASTKDTNLITNFIEIARSLKFLREKQINQNFTINFLNEQQYLKNIPQDFLLPLILSNDEITGLQNKNQDKNVLKGNSLNKNMKQIQQSFLQQTIQDKQRNQKFQQNRNTQSRLQINGTQSTKNIDTLLHPNVESSTSINQINIDYKPKHLSQNLLKNYSQSTFTSKRMTTINEQLLKEEDGQDCTTLQTHMNLLNDEENYNSSKYLEEQQIIRSDSVISQSEDIQSCDNITTPRQQQYDIISSQMSSTSKYTNQSQMKFQDQNRQSITNIIKYQLNSLNEKEILIKIQEEYQINEEIIICENNIKRVKADLHKHQKKLTQKNLKQNIDGLKLELKQDEDKLKFLQQKLKQIIKDRETLQQSLSQQQQVLNTNQNSNNTSILLNECDKDRKLKEMEQLLSQMQRKLEEKDQIIAETLKQSNIQEKSINISEINKKQPNKILASEKSQVSLHINPTTTKNTKISMPLSRDEQQTFSPKYITKNKQIFQQKPLNNNHQQLLSKQQSCAILVNKPTKQISHTQSQSSTNLQQLQIQKKDQMLQLETINSNQYLQTCEDKQQYEIKQQSNNNNNTQRVMPDRKKNNSVASLVKWQQKPSFQSKIQNNNNNNNKNNNNVDQNIINNVNNNKNIQSQMQISSSLQNLQQNKSQTRFQQSMTQNNTAYNSLQKQATINNTIKSNQIKSNINSFSKQNSQQSQQQYEDNYKLSEIKQSYQDKLTNNLGNQIDLSMKNIISLTQTNLSINQSKLNNLNLFQQNDDVDEGVQNIKKSIIPIRCINNLMSTAIQNSSTNQSFDSSTSRIRQTSNKKTIQNSIIEKTQNTIQSPVQSYDIKFQSKLQSSQSNINIVNEKNPNKGNKSTTRETSQRVLNKQEKKPYQPQITIQIQQNTNFIEVKNDQIYNSSKQQLETSQNSLNNEDIMDNTPPRIKQKVSQLASKNKFHNKQPTTIDLSIKGHLIINQGGKHGQHTVLRSQEVNLVDEKRDNILQRQRANSQMRDTSLSKASRKERLDSFLRKSFELMTTLRESADQVSQLKPINRAAIRQQSQERSGILSTKNLQTNENYLVGQMCGSFSSQNGNSQIEVQKRSILFGYQKTPQNNNHVFIANNLKIDNNTNNNDSICDHSRTMDNRSILSNQNLNVLVEKSLNCLKNHNASNQNKQQCNNLKEQILAKCFRNGMNQQQNVSTSQQLTSTQLRWMNRTLLGKSKSNESLQVFDQSKLQNEQQVQERPRSITLSKQNPVDIRPTKEIIENINKIPKWGELASIIKQNFSPSQSLSISNSQSFNNLTIQPDDKMNHNNQNQQSFTNQYFVKHNKIDLSQSINIQNQVMPNALRPPTNPVSNLNSSRRKKLSNEYQDENQTFNIGIQNQSMMNQDQSQLISNQQQPQKRLRCESQYMPSVLRSFEGRLRNSQDLQIQSPSEIKQGQYDLQNNSYQIRRLQQQQSQVNLSSLQPLVLNETPVSNTFGLQRILQQKSLNLHIHTNSNSSLEKPNNLYGFNNNFGFNSTSNKPQQQSLHQISSSADFRPGFFTSIVTPQQQQQNIQVEPIGRRDKAKPEITELIERQRSRINSQNKRAGVPTLENLQNYNSNNGTQSYNVSSDYQ